MNNEEFQRLSLENDLVIMNTITFILGTNRIECNQDLQKDMIEAYNKTKKTINPKESDLEKQREKKLEEQK